MKERGFAGLRIAGYAALGASFVAPGLFAGAVPAFRDFLVLVIPMRLAAARSIAGGDLPLWTPDLFLGAPFLANYQSAVFYPPSLLIALAPEPAGLSLFLGFHIVAAALGVDAYLRSRERLAAPAAAFGAVVYAAGGFFTSLLPLTNHLAASAWLPWILLRAERFADSGSGRDFVAVTLLLAVQLLCGAPETVLLTWLLMAARIARAAQVGDVRAFRVGAMGAAIVLALALSAVQLLPTAEYAIQTSRSEALPFEVVAAESIEWRSLQQIVLPHTFEDGAPQPTSEGGIPLLWSIYFGAIPLLALSAGATGVFWPSAASLALLLAMGTDLPFLRLGYSLLPGVVGAFRYPAKIFLVCHLALAVLAARGLAAALEGPAARRRLAAGTLVALILAMLLAVSLRAFPDSALTALGYQLRPGVEERVVAHLAAGTSLLAIRFAFLAGALTLLLSVAARQPRYASIAGFLLALITAAELVAIHRPMLGYVGWERLAASVDLPLLGLRPGDQAFHQCQGGFGCRPAGAPGLGVWKGSLRAAVPVDEQALALWSSLVPNVSTIHGIGSVGGTDGFETREQQALLRMLVVLPPPLAVRLLASYGVDALVGIEPVEGLPITYRRADPPLVVQRITPAPAETRERRSHP